MHDNVRPLTVPALKAMKQSGRKITMLTAYDATFVAAMDDAGLDAVLVGDSLGMAIQGHGNTLPVTMDQMVYHAACAARGTRRMLLIADLPFLSYTSPLEALHAAGRLLREGGVQMVKLEGGRSREAIVRALVEQDIPVCGHLGLLPQSVHRLGGYIVQGRDEKSAQALIQDAICLQEAGVSLLVLECVPALLAAEITAALKIPTIGIGAGSACDGQVLVSYDLLGLTRGKLPRFCKNFLESDGGDISSAFKAYVDDVRAGVFPGPEHAF